MPRKLVPTAAIVGVLIGLAIALLVMVSSTHTPSGSHATAQPAPSGTPRNTPALESVTASAEAVTTGHADRYIPADRVAIPADTTPIYVVAPQPPPTAPRGVDGDRPPRPQ